MYRTLQQTVNLAIAEHGGIETWDFKAGMSNEEKDAFVKKYFIPYLNVLKFCPSDNSVKGCAFDGVVKRKNGTNWVNLNEINHPKVLLADGSLILIQFYNDGSGVDFYPDVNGHKKPNVIGRDVFYFQIKQNGGVFFPGGGGSTREAIVENCKNGTGMACAAMIIQDGFKMNY